MKILVTGGAGYIGSHMVALLLQAGHEVTILDDLSTGHRDALGGGAFVLGCLDDRALLDRVFSETRFDGVMHFAGSIQVGESVQAPTKYLRNNFGCSLNLLDAMVAHGVGRLIFSSTAAVFGEPQCVPIDETHPRQPINPYGLSKLMVEQALEACDRAHGLRSVSLRYFNAAGADPSGRNGERHDPETHLIPLVLQAASGRRPGITVFGSDFPTADGTCVRDYVHIVDLCQAHLLALQYLVEGGPTTAFNLGNGNGYSVREVIEVARRVSGREIPVEHGPRRAGDPATLVAGSAQAKRVLNWQPRYAELETIVRHAWAWEQRQAGSAAGAPRER